MPGNDERGDLDQMPACIVLNGIETGVRRAPQIFIEVIGE
jgi:hypothetical protein